MNLADLKARTCRLLNAADAVKFKNDINAIQQIMATDKTGFADMQAKAQVLLLAITAIKKDDYFAQLQDSRIRLLLNVVINDGDISEKKYEDLINNKLDTSSIDAIQNDCFDRYQQSLITFLNNAQPLRNKYNEYTKSISLMRRDNIINEEAIDVQMDESETTLFEVEGENEFLSTYGLASCLGIAVLATTEDNDTMASLGHYSSFNVNTIKDMISDLGSDYEMEILPNTTKCYIAGGCIANFDSCLNLISEMSHDKITKNIPCVYHVGLSDAIADNTNEGTGGAAVSISKTDDNTVAVHYSFERTIKPNLQAAASMQVAASSQAAATNQSDKKRDVNRLFSRTKNEEAKSDEVDEFSAESVASPLKKTKK
ncbi:MAG: hypothetical protein P4M12_01615 [Gammaproteobacteria bacterium]|nr:hypothetical protein [Gammaproteobacteria bacterium]